jgi:hypothetical protein
MISNIGLPGEYPSSGRLHHPRSLCEILVGAHGISHGVNLSAEIYGDDVCALLGQTYSVTATLPAGGACDERDGPLNSTP